MAQNKTQPHAASVEDFITAIEHPVRQADARTLLDMMTRISGHDAVMWGPSIIGFGRYDYVYDSGHSGSSMRTGFSPRKAHQVIYIMPGYTNFDPILDRLGKYKKGKSCLYINKLADVDLSVLGELVRAGLADMAEKYPEQT